MATPSSSRLAPDAMDQDEYPIASSSRASSSAAAHERRSSASSTSAPHADAEEARWRAIRDAGDAAGPAAADTPGREGAATPNASSHGGYDDEAATEEETYEASTPSRASLSVDAEDEDVKIAIMALGAMKHLDGRSHAAETGEDEGSAGSAAARIRRAPSPARGSSSYHSASSAPSTNSTTISSPISTPGSETTGLSVPSTSSPKVPRTLGDLPPDFPFPAVVQDEDGNEVTVDPEMMKDADFLRKVSHLPIVRGTLRAYELSKQHSRVVKYGSDLVESGVKAISRPVVSRVSARLGEKGVEQLDAFAARQLERLYPSAEGTQSRKERQEVLDELDERERTEWKDMSVEEKSKRRKAYFALRMEEREREMVVNELRNRKGKNRASQQQQQQQEQARGSTALVATRSSDGHDGRQPGARAYTAEQSAAAARSQAATTSSGGGWGSMLVEAGVTAGGLSAAVSEESMKSLKYCLQWLQYATAHIEHQVTILRDLIVKLNHGELEISHAALQHLGNIKGDVVQTIRGVVDVVGKYAGGALPEPARGSVKAFILSLPARWATVNRPTELAAGPSSPSSFGGSPASPSFSAAHISGGDSATQQLNLPPHRATQAAAARQAQQMHMAATTQAANRVLTLAVESLDVLRSVTIVFGESLDRADLWVERLRVLGLQRKRAHEQAAAEEAAARIDDGMRGALSSPSQRNWESARGISGRHTSPGGDSNVSATTSGSKRRRVRDDGVPMSRSPSVSGTPAPRMSSHGISDDEGGRTETERPTSTRMASFTAGASSSVSPAAETSAASRRRKQRAGSKSQSGARTPSAHNTPAFKQLQLQDEKR